MSSLQIISKGLYKGTVDKSFPVEIKEYIYGFNNNRRCLLLRFLNNSEFEVNGIHFWLIQKNSYGEEIGKEKIEINGISAEAGALFSPADGFVVDEACVGFEIKMISAFSDGYEYRSENGEAFVRYPMEYYKKGEIRKNAFCYKHKKLKSSVKYSSLILVMAILLVAFALILPFFVKEVCPIIKRGLEIAWEFMGDVLESFKNMIVSLFDNKNS